MKSADFQSIPKKAPKILTITQPRQTVETSMFPIHPCSRVQVLFPINRAQPTHYLVSCGRAMEKTDASLSAGLFFL